MHTPLAPRSRGRRESTLPDDAAPWRGSVDRWLRWVAWIGVIDLIAVLGCGGPRQARHATSAPGAASAQATSTGVALEPGPSLLPSPLPVTADDATWGDAAAPVTLVEFSDLECPFCGRAQPSVAELMRRYGPRRLRVVFKHFPLPFHPHARGAAMAAEAVRQLGGSTAFFRYVGILFDGQSHLEPQHLQRVAEAVGVDPVSFATLSASPATAARIDASVALGDRVGVNGTPHFFVNGLAVSGAVPTDELAVLVDRELAETALLGARGARPADLYALRTTENFRLARAPENDAEPPPDTRVWAIPVEGSPALGPSDALVTIVELSDFQCPFCKRVMPTLAEVQKRYGADVRIVWKHLPLSFHPRARPAATLAIEARKKLGDAGFFRAASMLFDSAPNLAEPDLQRIAKELGLDWARVKSAIAHDDDRQVLSQDAALASDFDARGTPHFFVNGRRLVGAQPLEAFTALVDEELGVARQLVASGVARGDVYAEILKRGSGPPPPERRDVPAPTAANPSRGRASAPVVIQMFADLECPFCRRAMPTLAELEARHPGQLRVVYRHLPLEFHPGARAAATAAMEAFTERGADAFWKMTALLEADQDDPAPLTRDDLMRHARALGLDLPRFSAALDDGRHDAAIDADAKLATAAGIQGTPAFVINGYFVSGAQSVEVFDRLVERALHEASALAAGPAQK